VTGIPVRREFAADKILGREEGRWRILMMGNSLKVGETMRYLAELAALGRPLAVTLVTGRNQALARVLDAYDPPPTLTIDRRGIEPRLDLVMAESDFMVTKPGGIICSEALSMGLPMLFVSPIPNHEVQNAQTLAEAGAGLICFGRNSLKAAVQRLVDTPGQLAAMRRVALNVARPNAAGDIAAALLAA
jgi:processive 1,2-diacylglycerol beta-glucosyltransferase